MVFQDLSGSDFNYEPGKNKVAPVMDRFLAVFLDFVIFSPLLSLLFSRLFQKLELRHLTSPDSLEFYILLAITIFGISVTTILLQAVLLTYFGFTPGKYIFKLRVVSLEKNKERDGQLGEGGRLSFTQALLRSSLWVIEFFFLALPFIELFSHQKRQPLHDRAAGTLVVTLKAKGDQGPHPLETHFVRNFLFLFICVFMFWTAVVLTELYHMALHGDFKKKELVNDQYLCSGVSTFAQKETNRLDLALARYLTKEVDEDCLLNEADFALWTDHTGRRAWAYFAKGIYYQFDQEQANSYMKKTCEVDDEGEPCAMAKALLNEKNPNKIKKESLTAKIFEIKELGARGLYLQQQNKIQELMGISAAFETFIQVERTKALVALGKLDEAKGAYDNTWGHMNIEPRQNFSAWYCLEQLDLQCESRPYQSCENLKSELQNSHYEHANAEAVIALVKENECKKHSDVNMLAFHYLLEENSELKKLTLAMSSSSTLGHEARLLALREVAFGDQGDSTRFIQRRAMMALLEKSNNKADIEKVAAYVESVKAHDWSWQKLAGDVVKSSVEKGFLSTAQQMWKYVPTQYAETYQIEKNRVENLPQLRRRLPASQVQAPHELDQK